jgi:hypothetical protein
MIPAVEAEHLTRQLTQRADHPVDTFRTSVRCGTSRYPRS